MKMERWKKNLYLCCVACFIVSVGMSQLAPMLPLYLVEMGMEDEAEITRWSGMIFGANFISLAIAAPIWGRLSDKYGRKPMALRASFWLGAIMVGFGLATSPEQLFALRLMQGAMSGFLGAVVPLVAQEAPKEKSGWALGIFFTFQVSGALLGPLFGGWLVELMGCRDVFFFVGGFCFVGFASMFFVHESFTPVPHAAAVSFSKTFKMIPHPRRVVGIFTTTFLLHFSLTCVHPIITVYIASLVPESEHVALISGAVFSATGVASALAGSPLGHLSDRVGPERVMFVSLLLAGLSFLPQAFVTTPLELGALRFIGGIAGAGLIPSTNSLIRQEVSDATLGRIFGLNQSAQFIGMFTGAFFGGWLAGALGIASVFLIPGTLMLVAAVWFKTMTRK